MRLDFSKPKLLILVVGLVLVVIVLQIRRIRRFFNNLFSASDVSGFSELSEFGAVISDNKAKIISQVLYHSMYSFGTDEDVVFSSFEGLNKGDFGKVYNAFGERPYIIDWGIGSGDNPLGAKFDLIGWLKHDLTTNEFIRLQSTYPDFF